MSTTSLTTSISQSKIFQRTYSTLQDFVQSKHSYSERIEQNVDSLFTSVPFGNKKARLVRAVLLAFQLSG
jgi:hypothetical protein